MFLTSVHCVYSMYSVHCMYSMYLYGSNMQYHISYCCVLFSALCYHRNSNDTMFKTCNTFSTLFYILYVQSCLTVHVHVLCEKQWYWWFAALSCVCCLSGGEKQWYANDPLLLGLFWCQHPGYACQLLTQCTMALKQCMLNTRWQYDRWWDTQILKTFDFWNFKHLDHPSNGNTVSA